MTILQVLDVTPVTSEIGQLVNLKDLGLSGNQISVIPPEIGQLKNLQTLYLSNNQISAIPSGIFASLKPGAQRVLI